MLVISSNRRANVEGSSIYTLETKLSMVKGDKCIVFLRKIKHSWSLVRSSNNIVYVLFMNLTRKVKIWLMRRTQFNKTTHSELQRDFIPEIFDKLNLKTIKICGWRPQLI